MPPNQALQPTYLPPLRCGKSAAELGRWALWVLQFLSINPVPSVQSSAGFVSCTGIGQSQSILGHGRSRFLAIVEFSPAVSLGRFCTQGSVSRMVYRVSTSALSCSRRAAPGLGRSARCPQVGHAGFGAFGAVQRFTRLRVQLAHAADVFAFAPLRQIRG